MIKYFAQAMSRGGGSKIKSTARIVIKTQSRFHKRCQAQAAINSKIQMDYFSRTLDCRVLVSDPFPIIYGLNIKSSVFHYRFICKL